MTNLSAQHNAYHYFLQLPLDIFEDVKVAYIRKHYDNGSTYIVSFLKLTLNSLSSGWISMEEIEKELKENTKEFINELVRLKMLEKVDNMFHSYLVKNKYVHAQPISTRDRNTIKYQVWRKSVFERDNYTCQMCGIRGGVLNAHHIIRWCDEISKRYDVSNGMTLCEKCHKKIHKEAKKCQKEECLV